jgi:hypothetical protein
MININVVSLLWIFVTVPDDGFETQANTCSTVQALKLWYHFWLSVYCLVCSFELFSHSVFNWCWTEPQSIFRMYLALNLFPNYLITSNVLVYISTLNFVNSHSICSFIYITALEFTPLTWKCLSRQFLIFTLCCWKAIECLQLCNGKTNPLQAKTGLEGSRRLRLLDFKTNRCRDTTTALIHCRNIEIFWIVRE